MEVKKINAYKSSDDCIFENEVEAIEQNIDICLDLIELDANDNYSSRNEKIKLWFKIHKKEIKYILNNISKIR